MVHRIQSRFVSTKFPHEYNLNISFLCNDCKKHHDSSWIWTRMRAVNFSTTLSRSSWSWRGKRFCWTVFFGQINNSESTHNNHTTSTYSPWVFMVSASFFRRNLAGPRRRGGTRIIRLYVIKQANFLGVHACFHSSIWRFSSFLVVCWQNCTFEIRPTVFRGVFRNTY